MRAAILKDLTSHVFRVYLSSEESQYLASGLDTRDPKLQTSGSLKDGLLVWMDARGASIRKDLGKHELIAQIEIDKVGAKPESISPRGVDVRRVFERGRPALRLAPSVDFADSPFNGIDIRSPKPEAAVLPTSSPRHEQPAATAAAERKPTVRPVLPTLGAQPAPDPARLAQTTVQNAVNMADQAHTTPLARGLNQERIDAAIERFLQRNFPEKQSPAGSHAAGAPQATTSTNQPPLNGGPASAATAARAAFTEVAEPHRPTQPAPTPIVERPAQPRPEQPQAQPKPAPAAAAPQPKPVAEPAPPAAAAVATNVPALNLRGIPRPLTQTEIDDLRTGLDMVNAFVDNPAEIKLQVVEGRITHTLHMAVEMLNDTILRLPLNSVHLYVTDGGHVKAKRVKIVEEDL